MSDTDISYTDILLPESVLTKRDLLRLVREAERIDNEVSSDVIRNEVKHKEPEELQISSRFASFVDKNNVNLDDKSQRVQLVKQLQLLKDKVPVVHVTFATDADTESIGKLVEWFRSSVHPQVVIDVGLQPGLVAGAYIRTNNKVFDFSLKALLKGNRSLLVEKLEALRGES